MLLLLEAPATLLMSSVVNSMFDLVEAAVVLTALVAASALIPALAEAAARVPRRLLRAPRSRLHRLLMLLLLLTAGLRAPASAATLPPAERLETLEPDPEPPAPEDDSGPDLIDVSSQLVRPGDSLWAISCRTLTSRLGADPADADVDRYWRAIYEANRDLIGPDPDLIFPGQQLILPGEV